MLKSILQDLNARELWHSNNLGMDLDNFHFVLIMYDLCQENHSGIASLICLIFQKNVRNFCFFIDYAITIKWMRKGKSWNTFTAREVVFMSQY